DRRAGRGDGPGRRDPAEPGPDPRLAAGVDAAVRPRHHRWARSAATAGAAGRRLAGEPGLAGEPPPVPGRGLAGAAEPAGQTVTAVLPRRPGKDGGRRRYCGWWT